VGSLSWGARFMPGDGDASQGGFRRSGSVSAAEAIS
jgi:hypothetical protein